MPNISLRSTVISSQTEGILREHKLQCVCVSEGNQLPRTRSENTNILEGSETDEMAMEAQKGATAWACCDGRSAGGMSPHHWRPRQPSTDHMDPPKGQQRVQISSSS